MPVNFFNPKYGYPEPDIGFTDVVSLSAASQFYKGPTAFTIRKLRDWGDDSPYLEDEDEISQIYADAYGVSVDDLSDLDVEIPQERNRSRSQVESHARASSREWRYRKRMSFAPDSKSTMAASLIGTIGGDVVDPVSFSSMFIPIFGQARLLNMTSKYGSTVARAAAAGTEGAVGAAIIEPFQYFNERYLGVTDYDLRDSLTNIALSSALSIGLRVPGGALYDKFTPGPTLSDRAGAYKNNLLGLTPEGMPDPSRLLDAEERLKIEAEIKGKDLKIDEPVTEASDTSVASKVDELNDAQNVLESPEYQRSKSINMFLEGIDSVFEGRKPDSQLYARLYAAEQKLLSGEITQAEFSKIVRDTYKTHKDYRLDPRNEYVFKGADTTQAILPDEVYIKNKDADSQVIVDDQNAEVKLTEQEKDALDPNVRETVDKLEELHEALSSKVDEPEVKEAEVKVDEPEVKPPDVRRILEESTECTLADKTSVESKVDEEVSKPKKVSKKVPENVSNFVNDASSTLGDDYNVTYVSPDKDAGPQHLPNIEISTNKGLKGKTKQNVVPKSLHSTLDLVSEQMNEQVLIDKHNVDKAISDLHSEHARNKASITESTKQQRRGTGSSKDFGISSEEAQSKLTIRSISDDTGLHGLDLEMFESFLRNPTELPPKSSVNTKKFRDELSSLRKSNKNLNKKIKDVKNKKAKIKSGKSKPEKGLNDKLDFYNSQIAKNNEKIESIKASMKFSKPRNVSKVSTLFKTKPRRTDGEILADISAVKDDMGSMGGVSESESFKLFDKLESLELELKSNQIGREVNASNNPWVVPFFEYIDTTNKAMNDYLLLGGRDNVQKYMEIEQRAFKQLGDSEIYRGGAQSSVTSANYLSNMISEELSFRNGVGSSYLDIYDLHEANMFSTLSNIKQNTEDFISLSEAYIGRGRWRSKILNPIFESPDFKQRLISSSEDFDRVSITGEDIVFPGPRLEGESFDPWLNEVDSGDLG